MLGYPLSFYWSSGVKWIRMWSHRPWLRPFDQANSNFIPEYMSWALITLLTYPVSTYTAERSFSGMKRLQTPLRRTINRWWQMRDLALLQFCIWAQGRNWYWWHYNRVCLSDGYTSRPLLVTTFYTGAQAFNNLPPYLKEVYSIVIFKTQLIILFLEFW